MRHNLTYQHNVQRFFREHADKYDGVIIPLSIATSFPTGTRGFVRALCTRHPELEYAIDPRNAMFQKEWDRSNVRPPHEKMATALGPLYTDIGLHRPLTHRDFSRGQSLEQTVRKCIEFQKRFRISDDDDLRKLDKYAKLLGVDSLVPLKEPQHLIPPYFQFQDLSDPWYEISVASIESSLKYADGISVRPVLHFGRWAAVGAFDPYFRVLADNNLKGTWLYSNDFKEHDASLDELRAYRSIIEESPVETYSLFGGYFAVLMSYFGLQGFSNGIGYGEWRDSGYHRGGSAMTRVYLLKLHRYVDAPTAQSLIDRAPEFFGYDTDVLARYVESRTSVIDMSQQEALENFMESRKLELTFVSENPIDSAIAQLQATVQQLREIGELELEKFGQSLNRWVKAIG